MSDMQNAVFDQSFVYARICQYAALVLSNSDDPMHKALSKDLHECAMFLTGKVGMIQVDASSGKGVTP